MQRIRQRIRNGAFHLVDGFREKSDRCNRRWKINIHHVGNRFAHVESAKQADLPRYFTTPILEAV